MKKIAKQTNTIFEYNLKGEIKMKADVMLGIILGALAGATIVSMSKPAQNAVKKGAEMVKSEAKNMLNKQTMQKDKD